MKHNNPVDRHILDKRSAPIQSSEQDVYPVEIDNLRIYRSRTLEHYPQLKHAIFTRHTGLSPAPFRSLNLSATVGDEPDRVQRNFLIACQGIGVKPEQTVSCQLRHGPDILSIEKANRRPIAGQADGLITAEPDINLFMRFGDCTPLLFFDPVRQAVGLTHAGWRGTVQDAAGATIRAMVKRLECRAENIIAVIGPAIGPCCYEVGQDVVDAVYQAGAKKAVADPSPGQVDSLFHYPNGPSRRPHFDLWLANQRQLEAEGVQHVIRSEVCTACRCDDFFSHRAEKGRTGRFGVIIGLIGNPA